MTPRFRRAYDKLPPDVQRAVDQALKQFLSNPRHPSLHFEKLKGSSFRTIRVDRKRHRIVLRGAAREAFELVDIGHHDFVDRQYG